MPKVRINKKMINSSEYEVKSLTMEYDKVVRKQLARLQKAKH